MRSAMFLAALLLLTPILASAQEPWEGWVGPPADGLYGIRFGMDRTAVEEQMQERDLVSVPAREGTMRHLGKLRGQSVEVLTVFVEDLWGGSGGRLYRIQLRWDDLKMPAARAIRFFEDFDGYFQQRYGAPLATQDAGRADLETGIGAFMRLFQGPEMQVILEMKAPRPERVDLAITLDYPQLHPALPGYVEGLR